MSSITAGTTSTTTLVHSGDTTGSLVFKTNDTGSGGTTAVTIDTSQNVGIGTSSPSYKLDVQGTTANQRISSTTGTNAAYQIFSNTGQNFYVGLDNSAGNQLLSAAYGATLLGTGAYPMVFGTNNAERMRIDSSGNLLVGQTTLSNSTVGGSITSGGIVYSAVAGSNNCYTLYSTAASAFRFYVTTGGQINATSTSITAISDASLKENIRDLETGLTTVMALKPRRFDWKEETKIDQKNVAGFIAQELEQVLPELVYEYQYNATEIKKSIKMGDILPTLVKAIQELKAINDQQAETINALTARVVALEGQ